MTPIRGAVAVLLFLAPVPVGADPYFPLRVGNWWAYEEQSDGGEALARETWRVVELYDRGEFHLRSRAKRLDGLRGRGRRWEGHEFFREADDGLHKRYPAGRQAEVDVVLLKAPTRPGTRWQDAQGMCEVARHGVACEGPRGALADCVVVVCRLGNPTATVVTSTYARDVGMVEQEVHVLQLTPGLGGSDLPLPQDPTCGGRSLLRLTGFRVVGD